MKDMIAGAMLAFATDIHIKSGWLILIIAAITLAFGSYAYKKGIKDGYKDCENERKREQKRNQFSNFFGG